MVINGIDFKIKVNIKKTMKNINMRIKLIDNEYYLVINSYKKLKESDILDLISRNKEGINKLIDHRVINPLKENEYLLLGEIININTLTNELIEEGFNKIISLFNYYRKVFNRPNTILKFRKMKSRWGDCFCTRDTITLTSHLIHLPLKLTEYVIIHEFCHFSYPNHSKDFYNLVSSYCKDYKERVKEMKKYLFVLD